MVNGSVISDPAGDLLIRMQNAARAGRQSFVVPASKSKERILTLLQREGVIESFKTSGEHAQKITTVILAPRAHTLRVTRISKPGRQLFTAVKDIHTIKSGKGFQIVSTSKGVLSGTEAQKEGVGGEVIAILS